MNERRNFDTPLFLVNGLPRHWKTESKIIIIINRKGTTGYEKKITKNESSSIVLDPYEKLISMVNDIFHDTVDSREKREIWLYHDYW